MAGANRDKSVDDSDLGVRLASIPAGVCVTFVVCAAAAVDVSFYAEPSRRLALGAVLVAVVIGAIGTGLLPWARIVRTRWREPAFLAWSLSNVVSISAFNLIDRTPNGALALMFVIPIVFVSTSYPVRSVITVSAVTISAYLGVALASDSSGDFVVMFAAVLGCTALMGAWQARNHDRVRAELARVSRTDSLTGCLNRRGFQERAEAAVSAASAAGESLAVLLVDLDGFKQVNDTGGHAAGDAVLCAVTDTLTAATGPDDLIGRLGGDEFAVLLPGVGEDGASDAAGRLELALAHVTRASLGVAVMPQHGTALDALIGSADRRLYETKLHRRATSRRAISDSALLGTLGLGRAAEDVVG